MKPPVHKLCGTNHWSTEPCPAQKASIPPSDTTTTKASSSTPRKSAPKSSKPSVQSGGRRGEKQSPTAVTSVDSGTLGTAGQSAEVILAHKRKLKAEQMKRYRAAVKARKPKGEFRD